MQRIETLRPIYFQLLQMPSFMDDPLYQFRRYLFKQLHERGVFAEGEPAYLHLIDAVNIQVWEEVHVVVNVSFIALKCFSTDYLGTE